MGRPVLESLVYIAKRCNGEGMQIIVQHFSSRKQYMIPISLILGAESMTLEFEGTKHDIMNPLYLYKGVI